MPQEECTLLKIAKKKGMDALIYWEVPGKSAKGSAYPGKAQKRAVKQRR